MIYLNPIDYTNALKLIDECELTSEQIETLMEIVVKYRENKEVNGSDYIKFRKLVTKKL